MARGDFTWTLPAEITARLGSESWGSQRAIAEGGHLLLVTHEPPGPEGNTRVPRVFWRRPDGAWACNGREHGQQQLTRLIDDYRKQLDALEERYQAAGSADDLFKVLEAVSPLARSAGNLAVALQSAREHVGADKFLITQRDGTYEVSRGFELLLADAKLALDHRLARNAEDEARASHAIARAQHKLNLLASVTFPVMALSTVLGMNLPSGLENAPVVLFWLVFLAGAGMGVATSRWVTRTE